MNNFVELEFNKFIDIPLTPVTQANVIEFVFQVPFQNVPLTVRFENINGDFFEEKATVSSGQSLKLPYSSDNWSILVKLEKHVSRLLVSCFLNNLFNNGQSDLAQGGEYV